MSITVHYNILLVMRIFTIYFLNNFQMYDTELLTISPCCTLISSWLIHFINSSLTFDFIHPLHLPSHHPPLATINLFSIFMILVLVLLFFDSTKVGSYSTCIPMNGLFHYHDVLKVHPCCCKLHNFLLSCGWIIFQCVKILFI